MGVYYWLANRTKRECVSFHRAALGMKAWELTADPVATALVTWYLFQNIGDEISFVGDELDWPFAEGSHREMYQAYRDVTDDLVGQLVKEEILRDEGVMVIDANEDLWVRKLRVRAFDPPT